MEQHSDKKHFYFEVANNVWGMKDVFVNLYMVKSTNNDEWFLVDAGLKTSFQKIKRMASSLFGDKKPQAIILTHGHFDHIGSLKKLIEEWKVPVYAHYLELPYLTNKSSYPPPDPTVGGGLMAYMASIYPTMPADLGAHAIALPEDGSIPGFKEWRYIHTPGHTFGHISLFRDDDKVLIAGDAFITTKGESAMQSIFLQTKKVSRPPAYFTPDWKAANDSIKQIISLAPEVVATGHGKPMNGKEMRRELHYLHEHFYDEFVPQHGRYAYEAAVADASGLLYVPPPAYNPYTKWLVAGAAAVLTVSVLPFLLKKKSRNNFFDKLLSGI
ncbi:MAG TPA: MBL fold metallo-hydrolase [Parafilimonas sp.]|nr:MBL fold metallo-hydrolase [Parafilimonas sp.]